MLTEHFLILTQMVPQLFAEAATKKSFVPCTTQSPTRGFGLEICCRTGMYDADMYRVPKVFHNTI